jgi:hypothetical protein
MRDGQNVHDSLALNAAQAAIGRLGAGAPDASGEVRTYIELSGLSDDVKRDAVRVLELLDDATHSRLGVSQKDALGAVWARIHDPVNADNREGMKQTLVQMLASGVEHDVPVCSTGRLMRIVGALDGADAEDIVRIRPAWAVQEELGTLSAKVREDVLAGASEPERRAYETDTGNAAHGEMLFERMRDALVAKTHEDYVESGLMTEAALALRLEPYIAALEP